MASNSKPSWIKVKGFSHSFFTKPKSFFFVSSLKIRVMALQSNSDWSSLPEDLLISILDHLAPMADCIRFSAVCSQWRRVACRNFGNMHCNPRYRRPHQHQLPLLLVPTPDNNMNKRSLYDVRRNSLYEFQLKVPYNIRCGGSSHGWLIFIDDSFEVILFNPFSGKTIHLPPIKRLAFEKRMRDEFDEMSDLSYVQINEYEKQLREEYGEEEIPYELDLDDDSEESEESEESGDEQEQNTVDNENEKEEKEDIDFIYSPHSILRGVLSTNPELNPDEYILMVIYGELARLAFFKSGDKYWTYIDKNICDFFEVTYSSVSFPGRGLWHWNDIIYSNGLFHALDHLGVLLCCDVGKSLKVRTVTRVDKLHTLMTHKTYLVESFEGDLLRVIKVYDENIYITRKFVVYKLIDSSGNLEWMEVNTLNKGALFLGDNHSTSILARDFDGCQLDSIYFSVDCSGLCIQHGGSRDFGVYNLQDDRMTRHYILAHSQKLIPPPIWISPVFL